jgi:hypothetical protein
VRIQRLVHDPNAGEQVNVGRAVRINELVAIEVRNKGFLVYRKGAASPHLVWERDPKYSPQTHPGEYQWRFEIAAPGVRDHRTLPIRTKTTFALYNVVAERHLVFKARDGTIVGWRP